MHLYCGVGMARAWGMCVVSAGLFYHRKEYFRYFLDYVSVRAAQMDLAIVVLAAGKGTRMRSALPKVLHPLAGRPLVLHSVDLAARVSPEPPVLVIGYGAEQVRATVGPQARYVVQEEQLGTGHAVMQTEPMLADTADLVLVFTADMPLLSAETMRRIVATHSRHAGPITMLTVIAEDPRGFGRVLRSDDGEVLGIVEEVEATPEQRAIRELNTSVYCFTAGWLWSALRQIEPSPRKGEYYLTDTIGLAVAGGYEVAAVTTEDETEVMGINTRVHLAEAEAILRRRLNHQHMMAGVTMIDPECTYVAPGVEIGPDTTLWPGVCLLGDTSLGAGCEVGPGAVLTNVTLEDHCRVGAGRILQDEHWGEGEGR